MLTYLTYLSTLYFNLGEIISCVWDTSVFLYYKNNQRSEGIRVANARTKVIIFCKSRPSNCI